MRYRDPPACVRPWRSTVPWGAFGGSPGFYFLRWAGPSAPDRRRRRESEPRTPDRSRAIYGSAHRRLGLAEAVRSRQWYAQRTRSHADRECAWRYQDTVVSMVPSSRRVVANRARRDIGSACRYPFLRDRDKPCGLSQCWRFRNPVARRCHWFPTRRATSRHRPRIRGLRYQRS